jgi:hypothetical protein
MGPFWSIFTEAWQDFGKKFGRAEYGGGAGLRFKIGKGT